MFLPEIVIRGLLAGRCEILDELGYRFVGWYKQDNLKYLWSDEINEKYDTDRLFVIQHQVKGHKLLMYDLGNEYTKGVGYFGIDNKFIEWKD